jgi:predicted ATP-grasp superfamily ATP-dependent carboligase
VVCGGGLEVRPALIAALAEGRRLLGTAAPAVARLKDPIALAALLDAVGLPRPEIAEGPATDSSWLLKRAGGGGGGHIRVARPGEPPASGWYLQRRVAGTPVSALLVADGRRGRVLGWSAQWAAPADRLHPFRWAGAAQPAMPAPGIVAAVSAALDPLVAASGLVGLASLDLLVDVEAFHVLEVNPRPGATLDVFDGSGAGSLMAQHLAACEGAPAPSWSPPLAARAMAVVYADRPLAVPRGLAWPDWAADRSPDGTRFAPGDPVCTVLAEADDADAARRLALRRGEAVQAMLEIRKESPAA